MEWYFKVKKTRPGSMGRYLAWCARTPHLGEGPLDVPFEFETHAEFADTSEEALEKLRREVLN